MERILKHKNENGTFTYTNENGDVLKKSSKKNYEYAAHVAYIGTNYVFGTYNHVLNSINESIKHIKNDNVWMQQHKDYWIEKYGVESYNKHIEYNERMINAKVIKIENV